MLKKLITSFPRNTAAFLEKARSINTALTDNPFFKDISAEFLAALGLLLTGINELQIAFDGAKSRDSGKIAYRDQLQKSVATLLTNIAKFVELHAKGDENILKSSGFDLVRGSQKGTQHPLLTAMLSLRHGPSGTFYARGKSLPGAWRYEFYVTDGDPTKDENWQFYCDSPHCSHIEITGRTAGKNYSVKMRGIWVAGAGPWSQPVTLMSL
jgi:hypothetical protein